MIDPVPLHRLVSTYQKWFEALPEPTRQGVLARGQKRNLAPRQRAFSRGDDPDGLYLVLKGTVRLGGTTRDGREAILDFYGPGAWFGEVAVFDGLPRIHDVEALEDTTVLYLEMGETEALMVQYPDFARALLRLVAFRLRIMLVAFETYSLLSLEGRLASRLTILADLYGKPVAEGTEIELQLSHEILGQLVGATRQRVSQIVGNWQKQGIVTALGYSRLAITDPVQLEAMITC